MLENSRLYNIITIQAISEQRFHLKYYELYQAGQQHIQKAHF